MRIKKSLLSNQRKRTLNRNKTRLVNRRHTQFALDLCSNDRPWLNSESELDLN
ncbi:MULTISPECIES: hypothetical protein [unclassified Colwellia]|jgi:hypothetical protein|uniref:hypothetical protein n=1 Tax=unclassified Colwellia TaxID=196834 RepID=UPI0015F75127|nr:MULTISPECIES: hypothetical protein [unclassified Colwellia]MBA6223985.1 hypothetical protein [Colwellia sp. MB3u-45]MBA6266552.1 hypothetical protein [Colwellia sp. MB3u-43]MBA6289454.1 hypothetical protein [Colwellia sp. MB3u-4]MBA6296739.1 hypothetical protein [Colwellia sp. MB02u-9]MBA6320166.1 hypothetical protein [Colwellia sp. MB02u-19]